ncbi:TIGR04552 family protein [Pseudobacteriovorax antillogorgiicola]|uniref:TIGR04552 family protein/TIGR04562 family protein n=1 Tax=Pseudobacteriovorax antillogorgiicola TaxID=1513793 RepID=A0A1Y6C084_9BACT|nr:TIGR04552 family protein [Pseudobacteriovorax antillogorgiicola]TCS52342.1 uncharacterized protein (TIGR04552 family)/uncharacterized protein (TIGR04562 family) [Pseudobacteriovorax antillogorgiicola]SMF29720.1 TIGR04552 family protein/TIGR04562 family protein [Pseudobacteriovorax antillogorgiicola]
MDDTEAQEIRKLWDFNWGVMDVLIGGKSSIDLEDLKFRNWNDATEFLKYYGYDPDSPVDARKMHAVIIESWNFIERYLIPKEWEKGVQPPEDLLHSADVRDFIIAASDRRSEAALKQAWACAVLRIMHTIAHIDGVQRFADFSIAAEQIMQRFRQFIFRDEDGNLMFGEPGACIPLYKIEWKLQKSRESVILKLLHKKANVAETIYDLIGVRIIPRELSDVLVAVKFLRDYHMVTFANCNPSRSKNSLIDIETFKHNVETLRIMLDDNRISQQEFLSLLKGVTRPSDRMTGQVNPHSGNNYRSIQLTCRQLIRFPRMTSLWQEKLKDYLKSHEIKRESLAVLNDIAKLLDYDKVRSRKYLGFFPFEIQIFDQDTYKMNMLGEANHNRYKQSQIRYARRRVLGKVLTFKRDSLKKTRR